MIPLPHLIPRPQQNTPHHQGVQAEEGSPAGVAGIGRYYKVVDYYHESDISFAREDFASAATKYDQLILFLIYLFSLYNFIYSWEIYVHILSVTSPCN